jgi:hypothetical protein
MILSNNSGQKEQLRGQTLIESSTPVAQATHFQSHWKDLLILSIEELSGERNALHSVGKI